MASVSDEWRPQGRDIPFAFGLLTRLPIKVDGDAASARGADAAWAYSIVGGALAIGFILFVFACQALTIPLPISILLALAVLVATTGAMHLDGLADVLDGFWGGWDKDRRLEIMKDSQIGVYGMLGLAFTALLWTSLSIEVYAASPWAIVGTMALSRALMVLAMYGMRPARGTGLSHAVGRPAKGAMMLAIGIGLVACAVTGAAWAVLGCLAGGAAVAAIAYRKIGGQTGDVLGAIQVVSELSGLLVLVIAY